jgi:hypothetical protein
LDNRSDTVDVGFIIDLSIPDNLTFAMLLIILMRWRKIENENKNQGTVAQTRDE